MKKIASICASIAVLVAVPAAAEELRIGFLNTTTGSGALMGQHLERGWKLGLQHHGWMKNGDKLGGVPTRIFYADDQTKADVGIQAAEKFIKRDKVHIVSGIVWSNVLLAVQRRILSSKRILVSANAGPTPMAGKFCNPRFLAVGIVNDQLSEAMGVVMNRDGVKRVFALAPNYRAGKDIVTAFARKLSSGKIVGRSLFRLGQTDFQADLSKVRAAKPDAVFIFAPGSMGIAFVKQWVASGLNKKVKLYPMPVTVSTMTLPAIGDAAVGSVFADYWNTQSDHPRNKRFIKGYIARWGSHPSAIGMSAYDAVEVISKGLKGVNGKIDDLGALARAMRKGPFRSVRGDLKFNVNGFPITPFWRVQVERNAKGKPFFHGIEKIMEEPGSYADKCPPKMRL